MGGPQSVQDGVQVADVLDPDPFGIIARFGRPAGLGERPVHVPLHELDVVLAQELVERAEHPLRHVRPGQVQHQLVAVLRPGPVREVIDPVRVGAVEVAVRVYHLRLDPEPEPHAQAVHPVDERAEATRELRPVHGPVAEPGPVVVAAGEPPVVDHEALHAEPGGQLGQPHLAILGHVEGRGLPGVVQHRPQRRPGGRIGRGRGRRR